MFLLDTNDLLVTDPIQGEFTQSMTYLLSGTLIETLVCPSSITAQVKFTVDEILGPDRGSTVDIISLKTLSFNHFDVKRRLTVFSKFTDQKEHMNPDSLLLCLSPIINFECPVQCSALTGLLFHIQTNVYFSSDKSPLVISSVKRLFLTGMMSLNECTSSALQLDCREVTSDTPSLYHLFSNPCTPMGRRLMLEWFSKPQTDIVLLNNRLDNIDVFVTPDRIGLIRSLMGVLKHIKDVPRLCTKISSQSFAVGDYKSLLSSCIGLSGVYELLVTGHGICLPMFVGYDQYIPEISHVKLLLDKVVDFKSSSRDDRFRPCTGVDEQLDSLRHQYNNLEDLLTSSAREEINSLPVDCNLESLNVVYFPQLGFLVSVDLNSHDLVPDYFQLQFYTDEYAYFKSIKCQELDNVLGDIHSDISDLEATIERQLLEEIGQFSEFFLKAANVVSELDCILTMASVAVQYKYVRPQLVEELVVEILDGRNPVVEHAYINSCESSPFVPNNTFMGSSSHSIQLITGPNCSGKSVYLKQVGQIVFLAHIGSFVPAKFARIGIIDTIDTRMNSKDSIAQVESSFLLDCQQISRMFKATSPRSLLLIDEFGVGTDSLDGISLVAAVIKYFSGLKQPPLVLISTHFKELMTYSLLPTCSNFKCFRMDVETSSSDDNYNDHVIKYLYKLVPGTSSHSYALQCATKAGLAENIVKRASEITTILKSGKFIRPISKDLPNCIKVCQELKEFDEKSGNVGEFLQKLTIILKN
ncbi:hypothetical protein RCL1_005382 [Eukaryota sp. TZLM3-RCL]